MESLFSRIISDKEAFFEHQQRGDDDLTEEKKFEILKALFSNKLSVFVTRYQKYLKPVDCDIFAENDDFVVQRIVNQVLRRKDVTEKEKRNLRYNAMQDLLKEGVFFSDAKMREREPYLFDAMIGKFLNEEERMEHIRPTVSRDKSECTWSTLMDRLEDSSEVAERRKLQEREWESERRDDGGRDHIGRFMAHVASRTDDFVPEEEEEQEKKEEKEAKEEDEIEVMRKEMERLSKIEADQYDGLDESDTQQVLRHEFEAFMQQKFLAGKDKECVFPLNHNFSLKDDLELLGTRSSFFSRRSLLLPPLTSSSHFRNRWPVHSHLPPKTFSKKRNCRFYDYSKCEEGVMTDPIRERDDEERWFDED